MDRSPADRFPAGYRRSDPKRDQQNGKADAGKYGERSIESAAKTANESGAACCAKASFGGDYDDVFPPNDPYETQYVESAKSVLRGRFQESGRSDDGGPGEAQDSEYDVCACPVGDHAVRRKDIHAGRAGQV